MAIVDEKKLKILSDEEIVHSLLERDKDRIVTSWFFYKKCYPLFKGAFKRFKPSFERHHVMIENEIDLIHEIYAHVMLPGENGKCALDSFSYSCTLTNWLRIITKNYCLQCIKSKPVIDTIEKNNPDDGNYTPEEPSINIDGYDLTCNDVVKIINMVHIPRNREILYKHFMENLTSEEAAEELGITKAAYDNALSRAKKEFNELKEIHLK